LKLLADPGTIKTLMKLALLLGLLWAGWIVPALSGAPTLPRFIFCGAEYVRLEDFAAAKGFQLRWTIPKQEIQMTNSRASWIFTVDSCKSTFNNTVVWLSHPFGLHNTSGCIAYKDLTTAVQPLLSQPKNPPGKTVKLICLDAGHGGKDPGNKEGKELEKKYTLLLAKETAALLTKAGLKVCYTRNSDTTMELNSRVAEINRRKPDLLVSLHYNSADGTGGASVHGTEVFCMTPANESSTNARGAGSETGARPGNRCDPQNLLLAFQIQKTLVKKLDVEDRGVKRARFLLLRDATMPAVLIEGGFMTNAAESKKIYNSAWRRQQAQAIVDGILAYKKMVEQ
jgi:N-acetylmuramoyl-L-alanine amidase